MGARAKTTHANALVTAHRPRKPIGKPALVSD
jgi:hypothetical protein